MRSLEMSMSLGLSVNLWYGIASADQAESDGHGEEMLLYMQGMVICPFDCKVEQDFTCMQTVVLLFALIHYYALHAIQLPPDAAKHHPPAQPSREEMVYPGYIVQSRSNKIARPRKQCHRKHHAKHNIRDDHESGPPTPTQPTSSVAVVAYPCSRKTSNMDINAGRCDAT
jgi:hypothetical protein